MTFTRAGALIDVGTLWIAKVQSAYRSVVRRYPPPVLQTKMQAIAAIGQSHTGTFFPPPALQRTLRVRRIRSISKGVIGLNRADRRTSAENEPANHAGSVTVALIW